MMIFLGIFVFLIGLSLLHKFDLLRTSLKVTGICAVKILIVLLVGWLFLGCTTTLTQLRETIDGGGVERIQGHFEKEILSKDKYKGFPPTSIVRTQARTFYVYRVTPENNLGHAVATAYYFEIAKPRFIRHIRLHTDEPVKNTKIYVRVDSDRWKLARQFKSPVDERTRIVINMRGDAIRVIQNTISWDRPDIITDIEVYAQKK